MRYFLDMNIPIYFCLQFNHSYEEKAKKFINSKDENLFILCDYIVNTNLPNWIKRQKIILFEFNQKIQDERYPLFSSEQSHNLLRNDKMIVRRLVDNYIKITNKEKYKEKYKENINEIFTLLPTRIIYFIKKYIDEIVIPESNINPELKNLLLRRLDGNTSDAKTIASAIQEHNNKELKIITSDKKDWKKELLEEIHNNLELKKKYPKLPKIEYLQDL